MGTRAVRGQYKCWKQDPKAKAILHFPIQGITWFDCPFNAPVENKPREIHYKRPPKNEYASQIRAQTGLLVTASPQQFLQFATAKPEQIAAFLTGGGAAGAAAAGGAAAAATGSNATSSAGSSSSTAALLATASPSQQAALATGTIYYIE